MRILLISDPITPPSYAPRVMSFFRYWQEAGHDVVLESGELPKHSLWQFVGDKLWGLSDRQFGKMLENKYKRGRFDVIVCSTYYYFPLWTAKYLSRKWDIPYVVDLRDIVEQWGKATYFTTKLPHLLGTEKVLAHWYEQKNIRLRNRVMNGAKAVTTISPWHQQHLQSLTSTPVHLVYNGYDAAELHFEKNQTGTFSIAFIGRFIDLQLRQPQLLLEAVGKMGMLDVSLDFYAEQEKEQEVRQLAQQYGANERLRWHNYISRSELNEAMNEASILVALGCPPQEGQHGILGTKVFEAIGVEKPLLLVPSDEDSLAQLIRETGIGCAANTTQDIIDFIEDKYHEWQANGYTRQVVKDKEQFSRLNEAKEMETILL